MIRESRHFGWVDSRIDNSTVWPRDLPNCELAILCRRKLGSINNRQSVVAGPISSKLQNNVSCVFSVPEDQNPLVFQTWWPPIEAYKPTFHLRKDAALSLRWKVLGHSLSYLICSVSTNLSISHICLWNVYMFSSARGKFSSLTQLASEWCYSWCACLITSPSPIEVL